MNLKKRIFSLALVGMALIVKMPSSFAGGANGGGGTEIETGFKKSLISTFDFANRMPEQARAKLKFDPNLGHVAVSQPRGVSPQCASEEILKRWFPMPTKNKMAFVVDAYPKVIWLNCSDYSLEDWQKTFHSKDVQTAIFFIHEGLRATEVEKYEDDYGYSASYQLAWQAYREILNRAMSELHQRGERPSADKCYFKPVSGESKGSFASSCQNTFKLMLNGKQLLSVLVDWAVAGCEEFQVTEQRGSEAITALISDDYSSFISGSEVPQRISHFKELAYKLVQQMNCL